MGPKSRMAAFGSAGEQNIPCSVCMYVCILCGVYYVVYTYSGIQRYTAGP